MSLPSVYHHMTHMTQLSSRVVIWWPRWMGETVAQAAIATAKRKFNANQQFGRMFVRKFEFRNSQNFCPLLSPELLTLDYVLKKNKNHQRSPNAWNFWHATVHNGKSRRQSEQNQIMRDRDTGSPAVNSTLFPQTVCSSGWIIQYNF